MLGHLLNVNDKKWDCFNNLQEVTRLVKKKSFSNYDILKLGFFVRDFMAGTKRNLK